MEVSVLCEALEIVETEPGNDESEYPTHPKSDYGA